MPCFLFYEGIEKLLVVGEGTRRKAESVGSPPLSMPRRASLLLVLRCCYRRWGARAVPLAARLRALLMVPLVPLRALLLGPSARAFMRRACVGRRQTVQVLPTFDAALRRRATELSRFSEAGMVFLVFYGLPGLLGSPGDVYD